MTTAAGRPAEGNLDDGPNAWLARQGPHALVRAVRQGADRAVLALAVRPGTTSNSVAAITLSLVSDEGTEVTAAIPVFDSYRRQWSLDLTAAVALPEPARADWSGTVILTDSTGTHSLPLQAADPAAFALFSPPELAGLTRPWSLTRSTPPPNESSA